MATRFHFDQTQAFDAADADAILRTIPAQPGVFALFGPSHQPASYAHAESHESQDESRAEAKPYLTRAADLRRRIRRLLNPPEPIETSASDSVANPFSKRLNLRHRVARIEYTVTGSEFASSLVLYHAAVALFGYPEARRRLKLHTPFFLRFAAENDFPRLYVTNRLSRRSLAHTYGPFPSRGAAERYCDAILDLFKLRRCYEDLSPSPEHPGCVYQEMKKCLAPCNQALTPEAKATYSAEAEAVRRFLASHGESLLGQIAADRDAASTNMDFEAAAALHTQHQRAKSAAALADSIVSPLPDLRAVIVQAALGREHSTTEVQPPSTTHGDEADIFLMTAGCLIGPEPLSTLGVRAVKEQTSVGSSLFAQPLMLQAVPLFTDESTPSPREGDAALNPEARAAALLGRLEGRHSSAPPTDLALLSDHLSLFRRWYYRPEKQRTGEVFLPNADGTWSVRRVLRGAARMALGDPAQMAETDREAANAIKAGARTKTLHRGRPDVERVVAVSDGVASQPVESEPIDAPPTFTTRRKQTL